MRTGTQRVPVTAASPHLSSVLANSLRLTLRAEESVRWVSLWLTCLAFYYPLMWASFSVFQAAPGLARVVLLGYRLASFEIYRFGVVAWSVPPNWLRDPHPRSMRPDPLTLGTWIFVVLAVVVILAAAGRKNRTLSGLTVATLADVLLLPSLANLFFVKLISRETILAFGIFFPFLCLGLSWMLSGWIRAGYWGRVGSLFAGFVLPPALVWLVFRLLSGARLWPAVLILVGPSAVAALGVSFRAPSGEPERSSWRLVGWGALASLILVTGVPGASRALNRARERARLAESRAAMASVPQIPQNLPYLKIFFQKGVNFTAEFPNPYDSEGARQMLKQLPQHGVNAIALVPYGWSPGKKAEVHVNAGIESWESDGGLEMLSRVAHALGIKVMLKPGIWNAYNLEFSSAQDRAAWFDQYRVFLEHYARLATRIHADLFCVGGEFAKLTPYEAEWRKLIARARELYPGPLVYAANHGTEFETITFWDALDYIGLQEYYPLPDDLSTESIVQKVEAVQRKFQKPVIFTEAGFASYEATHREPWEDRKPRRLSPEAQARCYEAILRAFYNKTWFQGVYWWKVGTDGFGGPEDTSLTPWGKPAMHVIARWYQQGGR